MTMRKSKRKPYLIEQRGEPGRRLHKLMRKWQDGRAPRAAAPMEPQGQYSRFKNAPRMSIPYEISRW